VTKAAACAVEHQHIQKLCQCYTACKQPKAAERNNTKLNKQMVSRKAVLAAAVLVLAAPECAGFGLAGQRLPHNSALRDSTCSRHHARNSAASATSRSILHRTACMAERTRTMTKRTRANMVAKPYATMPAREEVFAGEEVEVVKKSRSASANALQWYLRKMAQVCSCICTHMK
jgi:hypothetical protein